MTFELAWISRVVMVTYTVDAIVKVIGHVAKIYGHPTQATLWQLKSRLIKTLRQLKHTDHPTEGHAPYLRSVTEQALVSNVRWTTPSPMGEYFVILITALTNTEQRTEEKKWISLRDVEDNFFNVKIALIQILEDTIDEAYPLAQQRQGRF